MARCGCNAASATTCDAIVLCVAANLGPGLRYNSLTGQLAVRLSGDAGNAASLGSDAGIYVPGGDTNPDPASGRRTVAGLGARIAGATQGGAGDMLPFGCPQSIEYGVANRLDFVSFHTYALADGVAVNRWTGPDDDLAGYTDNPATIHIDQISSLQLPFLNLDAGTRESPTGRLSRAPTSLLSPDGGWFGFYAPQFAPLTLSEALSQLAARAVALASVYGNDTAAAVATSIAAAIRATTQTLAQDWTIMGVPAYVRELTPDPHKARGPMADWVGDVIAAGITPLVDLFDEVELEDPATWWTPAEILATGARWVRVQSPARSRGRMGLDRIQELVDAGLHVIAQTCSRHWETTQMYGMGVRGIMADSPVYARGARGEAGDLDYRKTVVIPGLETRTTAEGALSLQTEDGAGSWEMGYARASTPGRYFTSQYGWEGGIGAHLHSQLLGELCPYGPSSNYRLRVRFRLDPAQTEHPAGGVPKLGLFVCSPTDRNITKFEQSGEPNLYPWTNGYLCFVRVGTSGQGQMVLRKVTNGDDETLADSASFPSIQIGSWIYMSVSVNPTSITLAAGHETQNEDIVYTVDDATHRGNYAYYFWEDDYRLPAENDGFYHGYAAYSSYSTTSPMYEDLSGGV